MSLIGAPRRPEIDQYAIKFLVGVIALGLPFLELALARLANEPISSISASFWILDPHIWPRIFFVGCLFAISSFLLAYNGLSETEMWLGKVSSVAALGIALFPCSCNVKTHEIIGGVHLASAATLFVALGWFCLIFRRRAKDKGHREARWRATIYTLCLGGMAASLLLFILRATTGVEAFVFWAETVGLAAFGVSWLTASRVLPAITQPGERQRLMVRTSRASLAEPPNATPLRGARSAPEGR